MVSFNKRNPLVGPHVCVLCFWYRYLLAVVVSDNATVSVPATVSLSATTVEPLLEKNGDGVTVNPLRLETREFFVADIASKCSADQ